MVIANVMTPVVQYYEIKIMKGNTYLRRTGLLTFLSLLFIGLISFIYRASLELGIILSFKRLYIVGLSLALWFEIVSNASTATESFNKSVIVSLTFYLFNFISILYLFFTIIFLYQYIIFMLIVAILMAYVVLEILSIPYKRLIGFGSPILLKYTIDHITDDSSESRIYLENFFTKFSIKKNVNVCNVSFRNKKGIKLLFVIPSIHPGPFYNLGGSNLPYKLYSELKGVVQDVMVFHSASTHADNMTKSDDAKKIAEKIKEKIVHEKEYQSTMTPFIKIKGSNMRAAKIGDLYVFIGSRYPNPTDDVDRPLGEIINQMPNKENSLGIYIDAHNSFHVNEGRIKYATKEGDALLKEVEQAIEQLKGVEKYTFKLGYSSLKIDDEDTLGPMGMQLAVFEVNNKKYALLLLDSNNILNNAYEKIAGVMKQYFEDFEILTTDNHFVNASMGFNPFGNNGIYYLTQIENMIKKAINDLESAEVNTNYIRVEDVLVFGDKGSSKLEDGLAMSFGLTPYILAMSATFLFILFMYSISVI
jgi:putative membrane protein